MVRIKRRPLAEEDLIDIWIYGCEKWGVTQADKYLDGIEKLLVDLSYSPKKHHLRKAFQPPIRICHYLSHLIIYTIEEHAITIIRVLHKSMDVKQHL